MGLARRPARGMGLLWKELNSLLREPMVIAMIVLPFVIYASMGPLMGGFVRQVSSAARLQGVRAAVLLCGDKASPLAGLLAEAAARSLNASVVRGCDPLALLREGYNVVVAVNASSTVPRLSVYVSGDVSRLMRTLTLPQAVVSRIRRGLAPHGAAENVTASLYVVIGGKMWSFDDLNRLYGAATTLSYAALFVVFPAASLGAAMLGAEREERTLEVLLSLPLPRSRIALAKMAAALVAALLAAGSAIAGLLYMAHSASTASGGGEAVATGTALASEILRYYGPGSLAAYAAAVALEALFAVTAAMLIGLFASTIRGAQAAASVVSLPVLLLPAMILMVGVPGTALFAALPYSAATLAALTPLLGPGPALASLGAQAAWTLAAAALLVRALEGEVAVTGPETVKRLRERLRRGRGRGGLLSLLLRRGF